MGNLSSKNVQIEVINQNHLKELFEICASFGFEILKDVYSKKYPFFRKGMGIESPSFSNYMFNADYTEVTKEQFEEILKSEQQCQK